MLPLAALMLEPHPGMITTSSQCHLVLHTTPWLFNVCLYWERVEFINMVI